MKYRTNITETARALSYGCGCDLEQLRNFAHGCFAVRASSRRRLPLSATRYGRALSVVRGPFSKGCVSLPRNVADGIAHRTLRPRIDCRCVVPSIALLSNAVGLPRRPCAGHRSTAEWPRARPNKWPARDCAAFRKPNQATCGARRKKSCRCTSRA